MTTAFIFPGQGSQKVGMGKALAEAFDICRQTFIEADDVLSEHLSTLCFAGPADRLMLTENTQPAILAVSISAYRLLYSKGLRPTFVAGHSLGEIFRQRGCRHDLFRGRAADRAAARTLHAGGRHGRGWCDGRDCRSRGRQGRLMKPAERRLAPALRALTIQDPAVPIVANVDADLKRTGASAVDALIAQVSSPVQWEGVAKRLAAEGVTTYVEVGHGTTLRGMIRKIHPKSAVSSFGSPGDLAALGIT